MASSLIAPVATATPAVLFVDLDGTLIRTDLLYEAFLSTLRHRPFQLWGPLWALRRGKAPFKQRLAAIADFDIARLPWREEVLQLIAERRASGDLIVLATASPMAWAQRVAAELDVFDDVLATTDERNLRGVAKLQAMEAYCRERGGLPFDYMGDSEADVPVWQGARRAYVVGASRAVQRRVCHTHNDVEVVPEQSSPLSALARIVRPHQWAKNLLVFVPLITSHRLHDWPLFLESCWAFVAFSACASAVYVLNDLCDIDADRAHPVKRQRPLAAGTLPVAWGLGAMLFLFLLSFGVAVTQLPSLFLLGLAGYFLGTTAYSLVLKRVVMLDVIVLACLYAARVLGGGLATGIVVSQWLIAFSLFIFVSLAFAKRYVELRRLAEQRQDTAQGRGYQVRDVELIRSMGSTAGYLAVLVFVLYLQSEEMRHLYAHPSTLWLLCPLLLYWVSRLWLKADRGELNEDPVVFALRDRVSLIVAALAGLLLLLAS